MGQNNNDVCSEMSRFVMDENLRLSKDFRKLVVLATDETSYLKT